MMLFVLTNGLVSGLILGAFLALCDEIFQTGTFQVLIDVSYISGLKTLHPLWEFLLHIAVSLIVACVFILFYPRSALWMKIRYVSIWMVVFLALYLPLSFATGQSLSWLGVALWLLGHVLYTVFLAYQVEKQL